MIEKSQNSIYAFRWYHYALQHIKHNIHHEIGRRKGCASVFLKGKEKKQVSVGHIHFDVSCTHSTYLSKSTTLGSLKRR